MTHSNFMVKSANWANQRKTTRSMHNFIIDHTENILVAERNSNLNFASACKTTDPDNRNKSKLLIQFESRSIIFLSS